MRWLAAFALLLGACTDETIAGYAPDTVWHLSELDGQPVTARVTFELTPGKVSGQAPCNGFWASQTAPAPWFQTGPIVTTKRACPDLALEQRFLKALAAARLAEASQNTLILADANNIPLMTFRNLGN